MANPSLQIGNSNWAIKEDNLLGYSTAGTRFVPQPITMTRASAGTRVNSSGLVETVELLGSEEVTNGDFSSGGTGWNITQSGNDTIIIENGYALFNCPDNSNIFITQPSVLTTGKTYKATFDVISIDSGGFLFAQGGGGTITGSPTINTTGTHTFTFVAATATFGIKRALGSPNLLNGSIDNISVKESTKNNLARVDYDGTASSLLVEPQRTNLITYSSDYSGWSKNGVSVTSGFVSPDGTTNASKITATSADPNLYKIIDVGLGKVTFSFYGKADEPYVGRILFWAIGTAVVSGTISNNFTLSNEWQRYEATIEVTTAGTLGFRLDFPINAGGNVGEYGYLWGAQVEEGSYATSYIPTDGSTVTRVQDQYSKTGISNLINSEEGVLFGEIAALSDDLTNREITLSDGSPSNYVLIRFNSGGSNRIYTRVDVGGGLEYFDLDTSHTITDTNKIAIRWGASNFATFINGVKVGSQLSGSSFSADTLNELNFDGGTGSGNFFGKVKQLQVFKTALTDTELATLTT
jgi:hypothetical protein